MQLASLAKLLAAGAWCHIVRQRTPGLGRGVGGTPGIECPGRILRLPCVLSLSGVSVWRGVFIVSQPPLPVLAHICHSELWMLGHFHVLANEGPTCGEERGQVLRRLSFERSRLASVPPSSSTLITAQFSPFLLSFQSPTHILSSHYTHIK